MEKNQIKERDLSIFDNWIDSLCKTDEVGDIEPMLIRGVLERMGANFEISEEAKKSLKQPTNKYRRSGLDAVWGKARVDDFKNWITEKYIPETEKRVGWERPTLYDKKTKTYDNNKHSGPMQFFGRLTSFAAEQISFAVFKEDVEYRIKKGKKWEQERPSKDYVPKGRSSFPEDFPRKAINRLKATISVL